MRTIITNILKGHTAQKRKVVSVLFSDANLLNSSYKHQYQIPPIIYQLTVEQQMHFKLYRIYFMKFILTSTSSINCLRHFTLKKLMTQKNILYFYSRIQQMQYNCDFFETGKYCRLLKLRIASDFNLMKMLLIHKSNPKIKILETYRQWKIQN